MTETILLVDDDNAVRALLVRMLRLRGYEVLEASSGEQARQVFEAHEGRIDLLVCDMLMPGVSGAELAETLTDVDPALRLLFMSGFPADNEALPDGVKHAAFLQKPFTARHLADSVTEVLAA